MTEAEVVSQFTLMKVEALRASPDNPRKRFDPEGMKELTANVKANGIIEPIVVRPMYSRIDIDAGARQADPTGSQAEHFEIVAGERRWRAATAAKLTEVPVRVMQLSDSAALEIMLSENLQRRNIHPLEEAQGLRKLISQTPGINIEDLATRLGVTARYIFDRERLLQLSPAAKKLFLADRFPLRHAILLSRLSDRDQDRVLDVEKGGMFSRQRLLTAPGEPAEESLKHNSADELKSWIDQNVRLDPTAKETAELFPDLAKAVGHAVEKVVHITHLTQVTPEALVEGKILGPKTWKRADPSCPHAAIGVVVIGPHTGDSFRVCYDRARCSIHWAAEQREARLKAASRRDDHAPATPRQADSPDPRHGEPSRMSPAANAHDRADEARAKAEREEKASREEKEIQTAAVAKEVISLALEKLSKSAVHPALVAIAAENNYTFSAMEYIGGYPARSRKGLEKLSIEQLVRALLMAALIEEQPEQGQQPGVDVYAGQLSRLLNTISSALSIDVKKVRREIAAERLKQKALAEQAAKLDALPKPPARKHTLADGTPLCDLHPPKKGAPKAAKPKAKPTAKPKAVAKKKAKR